MTATASTRQVVLNLGDWHATDDPTLVLACLGLGSCVAFAAHDAAVRVGGMAHMVLPDSDVRRGGSDSARFVDRAIPLVLERMEELGARRERMQVHLVGGAQVLRTGQALSSMNIGAQNARSAEATVSDLGLTVLTRALGGVHGRTVRLVMETGAIEITSVSADRRAQ